MLDRSSDSSSTTRALLERCHECRLGKDTCSFLQCSQSHILLSAVSQVYKVPSPKHLGRGTVSPTQRLVTPSTHSMLSYCFDVNESAW